MLLKDCNPYIRVASIQAAILERTGLRKAYDYRLFYILENTGSIIIENSCYDVLPDTIIIIPPATAYDFRGKLRTCVLNFDITRKHSHRTTPLFPPHIENFDLESLFETELLEGFDHPRLIQGDIYTRESILRIIKQFNIHGDNADAASSAMLKLFFAELLNRNTSAEDMLVKKIISYIRIHAPSVNSNANVAQAFGYHPVYLNHLFKHVTGKTLHGTIMDTKLQIACQWLIGTDEKIDAVAHLAGFSSRTHFCTAFKKRLGISPIAYRKTHEMQIQQSPFIFGSECANLDA